MKKNPILYTKSLFKNSLKSDSKIYNKVLKASLIKVLWKFCLEFMVIKQEKKKRVNTFPGMIIPLKLHKVSIKTLKSVLLMAESCSCEPASALSQHV